MKNRLLLLILLMVCSLLLFSCKKDDEDNVDSVTIESIEVVSETVPSFILDTELDNTLESIKLKVTKSDASTEEINVKKTMISSEDYAKLAKLGKQKISIAYEGKTTEVTLKIANYTAKVVYPDNTPVTSSVTVQWCDEVCYLPEKVNANGEAGINLDEGEYFIHINNIPAGYTYDPNAYIATESNKAVIIKLIQLSTISTGDGSNTNPYVVGAGAYTVTYEQTGVSGMKWYSFTPSESGTYSIVSLAVDKLATNPMDPYIGFVGTTSDPAATKDTSGNIQNILNFKHTFEAEAGVTYYFVIMLSSSTNTTLPASFDITISK